MTTPWLPSDTRPPAFAAARAVMWLFVDRFVTYEGAPTLARRML
jgi:hypothetical protein